jgi:hypothetical protein
VNFMGYYFVQGMYECGTICYENQTDDELEAIKEGMDLLKDPTFEGEHARVMTGDGELVWEK